MVTILLATILVGVGLAIILNLVYHPADPDHHQCHGSSGERRQRSATFRASTGVTKIGGMSRTVQVFRDNAVERAELQEQNARRRKQPSQERQERDRRV